MTRRRIASCVGVLLIGATAFIRGADMDHLEYIGLLLNRGANPNVRGKENTLSRTIFTMQWFFEPGATPFVRAAQSSDVALMKLLLAHGADPELMTEFGDTALTASGGIGGVTYERSPKENLEAVRLLLDLGLDPNAVNKDGRTPLWRAPAVEHRETAALIRKLMTERGLPVPPANRTVDSICVVEVC